MYQEIQSYVSWTINLHVVDLYATFILTTSDTSFAILNSLKVNADVIWIKSLTIKTHL